MPVPDREGAPAHVASESPWWRSLNHRPPRLRTGVRWLELTTPRGHGGLGEEATGDNLLECSVVPTTLRSPAADRTAINLVEPKQFILRIDHRNTGLGGIDSWGQ